MGVLYQNLQSNLGTTKKGRVSSLIFSSQMNLELFALFLSMNRTRNSTPLSKSTNRLKLPKARSNTPIKLDIILGENSIFDEINDGKRYL